MFINLKDVVKKYGEGENIVYALNNSSLSMNQEEICVIMGPSGSGKSTLLNIIGGLDTADIGTITIDNENISTLKSSQLTDFRRRSIGFVFQFYNLIFDLTVKENIEIVSDICENPLNIDDVMKALNIHQLKDRFPKELSGGQQQRVAIARALIKRPKILLCDEPTGALDSKSSIDVLKFIQKVNREFHTLVVIITHNDNISKIADRIIRIKDGQIIENFINDQKFDAENIEL